MKCKDCGALYLSEHGHICAREVPSRLADRLHRELSSRYPAFDHMGQGKLGLRLESAEWRIVLAALRSEAVRAESPVPPGVPAVTGRDTDAGTAGPATAP